MCEESQPIHLGDMPINFAIDGASVCTSAKAFLHLSPRPHITFDVSDVPRAKRESSPILSDGPSLIGLEGGATLKVVPSSWAFMQREASLRPASSPCTVLQTGSAIRLVKFDILNLDLELPGHFAGGQFTKSQYFTAPPWLVRVEEMRDPTSKLAFRDDGYAITHQGVIERLDNETFSVEEAIEITQGLTSFLSFASGSYCSPAIVTGLDSEGNETWKQWGASHVSSQRHLSWSDITTSSELSDMFREFMNKWTDLEWKEALDIILGMYLSSNETSNLSVRIILTQAALERIAHQMGDDTGGEAGNRIAAALGNGEKIGDQIPEKLTNLRDLAEVHGWEHGPHALVEIRNDIIHPKRKLPRLGIDVYHEAGQLGLWYIEMMLLRMFGYDGEYSSRFDPPKISGKTEPLPWSKGKGNATPDTNAEDSSDS